MGDLIPIAFHLFPGLFSLKRRWGQGDQFVEQIADGLHHFQIALLIVAPDVVGLSHSPFGQDQQQRTGMIFHIEPVADLISLAIKRDRLAREGVGYGL